MSISKLAFWNRKPVVSAADAYADSSQRRGKWTSDTDPDAPSFGDTLQESQTQLTQARTSDTDTKPSKNTSQDDSQESSNNTQEPADQNPPQTQASQDSSGDNADPSPATPAPKSKDPKATPPPDPSTDALLQALAASSNVTLALAKAHVVKAGSEATGKNSAAPNLAGSSPAQAKAAAAAAGAQADAKDASASPASDDDSSAADAANPATSTFVHNAKLQKEHELTQEDGPAKANASANADPVDDSPLERLAVAVPPVSLPAPPPAVPAGKTDSSDTLTGIPLTAGAPAPAATPPAEVALPAHDSHAASADDPMDQIILGLKSNVDMRSGKAEIRLDPPNLGAVKVSLSLQAGALTAQFESSSEMVRDLLKTHLDKLKTVLQNQGMAVDRLAVEPPADAKGQGQSSSFGSASHDGRSAGQYQQDPRQQRGQADAEAFADMFSKAQEAPLDLVA